MTSRPLSSTPALWRLPFGHYSESDLANKEQRLRILAHDGNTCVDCGLKLARHMEVRHLDDNHDNNNDSNLVCDCPFCHLRDHLGPTGFASAGILIGAPALTQAQVNSLSLAVWYIQSRITSTADIRHEPAAIDLGNEEASRQRLLDLSAVIWKDLSIHSIKYALASSSRITEPDVLGGILNELHDKFPDEYARRDTLLKGLHILPSRESFSVQCEAWFAEFDRSRPIASWSKGLESFINRIGGTAEDLLSELDTPPAASTSPPSDLLGTSAKQDKESEEPDAPIRRTGKRYE